MCVKTFFPSSVGSFNPNGPGYVLLKKGYEVSVDDNGYIVDARDPRTNKLYASDGTEVGTRNKPFESDDQREIKTDIRKKYTPDQKGEFIEGSDIWQALNAGRYINHKVANVIVARVRIRPGADFVHVNVILFPGLRLARIILLTNQKSP